MECRSGVLRAVAKHRKKKRKLTRVQFYIFQNKREHVGFRLYAFINHRTKTRRRNMKDIHIVTNVKYKLHKDKNKIRTYT